MSYDYHELNRTSINAPLVRENNQNPFTETVAENVERVLAQGCNPEKVIMGIPTYGRTYTLKDASNGAVDAPVDGLGEPGPFTLSNGSLGFNEVSISRVLENLNLILLLHLHSIKQICYILSRGVWNTRHLLKNASKVAQRGKQWIAYDDPETVYQKVKSDQLSDTFLATKPSINCCCCLQTMFAMNKGLGGVMFWTIDTDDFRGNCYNISYPLINTSKQVINDYSRTYKK